MEYDIAHAVRLLMPLMHVSRLAANTTQPPLCVYVWPGTLLPVHQRIS